MPATVDLDWTFTLPVSATEVWKVLADTDGFNRTAGLDFHFQRVDGEMRGSTVVAGIRTDWLEEPIVWESPKRFASERTYSSGPIVKAAAGCLLVESEGSTQVHYRVKLTPRNVLLSVPVRLLALTLIRPGLNRALRAVQQAVLGDPSDFDVPPPLSKHQRENLERDLEGILPQVAQAIRRRIVEGSLRDQHSIRPLEIAAETNLPPEDVVRDCVLASIAGALKLEVQILCPRCRGGQNMGPRILLEASEVHCSTCAIDFDSNLIDNVEVVFAPGERVRSDEVSIDCVFSPMRTPHIVAQLTLEPNDSCTWESDLEVGGYRLESGSRELWVVVSEASVLREVQFDLGLLGFSPRELRVAPGTVRFHARNRTESRTTIALHSRWLPPHALRVSQLFEFPSVRSILPQGLVTGLRAHAEPGVVAVLESDARTLERAIELANAPSKLLDRRRALLRYPTVVAALEEAERFAAHELKLKMAMSVGAVLLLEGDGFVRWTGPLVHEALRAVQTLSRPAFALTPEAAGDAEVAEALRNFGDRVQVAAPGRQAQNLSFATWGKASHTTKEIEAKELKAAMAVPERIAHFEIRGALDRSGMGHVYVAEDQAGRQYALKRSLLREDDDGARQQFHTQAYYASVVEHPNLVEVLDWGVDDGRPFLLMEILEGESLASLLARRGRLPLAALLDPLLGVMAGLEAALGGGLAFRRLGPAGVFLLEKPNDVPYSVKLLYSGLTHSTDRDQATASLHSPAFTAPNKMKREVLEPRTDVFAVGALAYHALTGSPAWRGRFEEPMIQRRAVNPVSLAWDGVEPSIARVLQRALQPDRDARIPDLRTLGDALRNG